MSRIASLLVGASLALGLAGCDVDVDDREPDVIDPEPDGIIIDDEREPDVNLDVDNDPDGPRPGVDLDIDTDPDGPAEPLNPPGTAGEGTTLQTDPE